MPIPSGDPQVVAEDYSPAPTRSPFYLRVNGVWLPLEGVNPGTGRNSERASSSFNSVDGVGYVQQAYLAQRTWEFDWTMATPASVAAVAFAAQNPHDVWLWDETAARANALPDYACYGPEAHPVLLCGGFPLRSLTAGSSGTGAGATVLTRPIVPGFPLIVAVWTDATAGTTVGSVDDGDGSLPLVAPAGTGPRVTSVELNAPEADSLTITIPASTTYLVSGLTLTDGLAPSSWLPGQATPCQVSVSDPSAALQRLPQGRMVMADYAVTLREVG